ncbi:MAG: phosphoglycerate mutase, partial [Burkholderiaceae bacterium]
LLLGMLAVTRTETGSPDSLTPPHEKACAQALGLPTEDGLVPWAAWAAARAGIATGATGWAWVTPAHWDIGTHQIQMTDPATLVLPQDMSESLMQAMAPYFAHDGITLQFDRAGRWLAYGEALRTLPTASLDRVIDTDLAPWMPASAPMRRLQNEMQMLLYTHPVNDARSAQGLPTVNSFWISGSGSLPTGLPMASEPTIADALRRPALHRDWAAWSVAWQQIDQGICQEFAAALARGEPCELVLCSERHALHFTKAKRDWRTRLQRRFKKPSLKDYLPLL